MHSANEVGNIGIRPGNRWYRKREAEMSDPAPAIVRHYAPGRPELDDVRRHTMRPSYFPAHSPWTRRLEIRAPRRVARGTPCDASSRNLVKASGEGDVHKRGSTRCRDAYIAEPTSGDPVIRPRADARNRDPA